MLVNVVALLFFLDALNIVGVNLNDASISDACFATATTCFCAASLIVPDSVKIRLVLLVMQLFGEADAAGHDNGRPSHRLER